MANETMYDLLIIPIGLAVSATILLTASVICCFWSMRRGSREPTQRTATSSAIDVAIGRRQEADGSQENDNDLELGVTLSGDVLPPSTHDHEILFDEVDLKGIVELGVQEQWYIFEDQVEFDMSATSNAGSWGSVFKARLQGDIPIAIKAPARHDLSSAGAIANEMRLFRQVRHTNIVHCYGVSILKVPDPKLCLFLEWVSGGDFEVFVKLRRVEFKAECKKVAAAAKERVSMHITDIQEVKLLADVAAGMQYLHSQTPPILHMDLKPQNILIQTGSAPVAKIADFGFSKHSKLEDCNAEQAQVGTLRYMAPEVLMRRPYTLSADVYSYGCTMLFALSGKHPAKTKEALDSEIKKLRQEAELDELPALLIRLIRSCMRVRQEKRPTFDTVLLYLRKDVDVCGIEDSSRTKDLDSSATLSFTPLPSHSWDHSDNMKSDDDAASSGSRGICRSEANEQKLNSFLKLMRMRRNGAYGTVLAQAHEKTADKNSSKIASESIRQKLRSDDAYQRPLARQEDTLSMKSGEKSTSEGSSSSKSFKQVSLQLRKHNAAQALEAILDANRVEETQRCADGAKSSKSSL
eukprot:TRINITY_DN9078_c0_g3_i1.p1 TRINITY_DN9078_c0_g3~~TRINITY_DN9078_c0_g3_i1.p1  ORF type:complete len:579 (+),score=111.62 TRINITY_DN9078_c0_g3_i1:110-1846(+)